MRCVLLSAIVAVSLSTAPVLAQGRGQGGGKSPTPAATEPSSHRVSDREVAVIREYFRDHGIKPKPLPPGIAKNLARGKPLPPGIARTRMPGDLLTRLSTRPDHQWVVAGNVVVLVDPVGLVVDILREVF
jgi:hypothetical protein